MVEYYKKHLKTNKYKINESSEYDFKMGDKVRVTNKIKDYIKSNKMPAFMRDMIGRDCIIVNIIYGECTKYYLVTIDTNYYIPFSVFRNCIEPVESVEEKEPMIRWYKKGKLE
jgi:hypothetical protein